MSAWRLEQDDGPTVHVWTQEGDDQEEVWACCAYDHGPFCRLCQPVDDVLLALLANVEDGRMRCRAKSDGEFEFQMTQKGNAAVEGMLATDPEIVELWGRLTADLKGETDGDD